MNKIRILKIIINREKEREREIVNFKKKIS